MAETWSSNPSVPNTGGTFDFPTATTEVVYTINYTDNNGCTATTTYTVTPTQDCSMYGWTANTTPIPQGGTSYWLIADVSGFSAIPTCIERPDWIPNSFFMPPPGSQLVCNSIGSNPGDTRTATLKFKASDGCEFTASVTQDGIPNCRLTAVGTGGVSFTDIPFTFSDSSTLNGSAEITISGESKDNDGNYVKPTVNLNAPIAGWSKTEVSDIGNDSYQVTVKFNGEYSRSTRAMPITINNGCSTLNYTLEMRKPTIIISLVVEEHPTTYPTGLTFYAVADRGVTISTSVTDSVPCDFICEPHGDGQPHPECPCADGAMGTWQREYTVAVNLSGATYNNFDVRNQCVWNCNGGGGVCLGMADYLNALSSYEWRTHGLFIDTGNNDIFNYQTS